MTRSTIAILLAMAFASLGLQAKSGASASGNANDMPDQTLQYTPMFEVGKEWRYTQRDYVIYRPQRPDRSSVLRVVDKIEFEGKELFHLQSFWDGGEEPGYSCWDEYLWEDAENRRIMWLANFDKPNARFEMCLWNFNDLKAGEQSKQLFYLSPHTVSECDYEALDGVHKALRSDEDQHMLVEGLGVIAASDTQDYYPVYGDRFQFMGPGCSGDCGYLPLLYEIADGDGNVIYSLDSARPGASLDAPDFTETTITVSDGGLEIVSGKEIGDVTVVSAAGATVFNGHVADTRFVYATDHLLPGGYILRANGNTRKFTVK